MSGCNIYYKYGWIEYFKLGTLGILSPTKSQRFIKMHALFNYFTALFWMNSKQPSYITVLIVTV